MGYNTSVIVLNDALSFIESDPEFGRKLSRAVGEVQRGMPADVTAGGHCNAATVIESHHADCTSIVTFGGNLGLHHLTHYGWRHNEAAVQEVLLREWADKLGFRLVRKSIKG